MAEKNKKNLLLKIVLPVLIVAVIAVIWVYKTNDENQKIADSEITSVTTSVNNEEVADLRTDDSKDSSQKSSDSISTTSTMEESEKESEDISSTTSTVKKEEINPDFLLEASEIDIEKLKSYGLPFMIDFGADSCVPCKEMAPVLQKLNKEWQGKIIVKFVDVWKNPNSARDFPVQVIPTQFFFDAEGKPFVPADPVAMQMQMYLLKTTNEHVYTAHMGGMTEEQIRAVFEEMGVK